MGRAPCCEKVGLKRGRWTPAEDALLMRYIQANGEGSWRSLPKNAGLLRCGKSCRLRWINYLRADLKRGNFSKEEEDLIIKLHSSFGNRWSLIAAELPGRTDNEIKNYWNSHLSRRIHTFLRPRGEAKAVSMNLAAKNRSDGRERKIRSLTIKKTKNGPCKVVPLQDSLMNTMKETNTNISSTEGMTNRAHCETSLLPQETLMGIQEKGDESMILDLHGENQLHVVKGPYQEGILACDTNGERENGILVQLEKLENGVVYPIDIKRSNGVLQFGEERESECLDSCKRTTEEEEFGALTSNVESCELYSSSSSMNSCIGDDWMNSCFEGGWINMELESMMEKQTQLEGGDLLSWLEGFHC